MMFNPVLAGFLRWDGAHKTQNSYSRTDNRILFGANFKVNGGPFGVSSPEHDYNLMTGINGDFKPS